MTRNGLRWGKLTIITSFNWKFLRMFNFRLPDQVFVRRSNGLNGPASVRFMIVLPVLMLFPFGIIQVSSVLNQYNLQIDIANAARKTAQSMSVGEISVATQSLPEAGSAEQLALGYLNSWNMPFSIVASEPDPSDPNDDKVSVQISVPASQAAFGDMFGIWGSSTLTATVTMRKEG